MKRHQSILCVAEQSGSLIPARWVRYLRIPALAALVGMLVFGLSQM